MDEPNSPRAPRIALAVSDFQRTLTGRAPSSLAVVLSGATLVVTLHGALAPAEMALAGSPDGHAHLQELHRQLFASACSPLRQEIGRIVAVEVRKATTEAQAATGTVVMIFLLAGSVPAETWSGTIRSES